VERFLNAAASHRAQELLQRMPLSFAIKDMRGNEYTTPGKTAPGRCHTVRARGALCLQRRSHERPAQPAVPAAMQAEEHCAFAAREVHPAGQAALLTVTLAHRAVPPCLTWLTTRESRALGQTQGAATIQARGCSTGARVTRQATPRVTPKYAAALLQVHVARFCKVGLPGRGISVRRAVAVVDLVDYHQWRLCRRVAARTTALSADSLSVRDCACGRAAPLSTRLGYVKGLSTERVKTRWQRLMDQRL